MTDVVNRRSALICATGVVFLCPVLFFLPCNGAQRQPAQLPDVNPQLNRSLKILYAGRPGSDREKDFVGFLKQYFDVVRTGNLESFKEADTQGFDVTILDWDVHDSTSDFEGPKPDLPESFSRPLVTLGIAGSWLCSHWRLKTGYG